MKECLICSRCGIQYNDYGGKNNLCSSCDSTYTCLKLLSMNLSGFIVVAFFLLNFTSGGPIWGITCFFCGLFFTLFLRLYLRLFFTNPKIIK